VDARFWRNAAAKAGAASPLSDLPGLSPARQQRRQLRFPRSCRLVRRKDFEAVYRSGKRRSGPQLVVFCRRNGLAQSRFGTSVRRQLGTAVERNRIRRRVREIVRLHRREIAAGWDIVIQPRRTAARAQFACLEKELVGHLRAMAGSPS
jgi:ribonuclease P protein component